MTRLLTALLLVCACTTDSDRSPDPGATGETGADGTEGSAGDEGQQSPEGEACEEPGCGANEGEEDEMYLGRVVVLDATGDPVPEAFVLAAGAPQADWILTDDEGRAHLQAGPTAGNEPYIMATKRGWFSAGGRRPKTDVDLTITLRPLPDPAETNYTFGRAGNPDDFAGTERCMHCHETIGEQWNRSAHKGAMTNPVTLDLYDDAVSAGTEASASCGDCHAPVLAAPRGRPDGGFDLRAGAKAVREEGVTCDLCHKIVDVTPDAAKPGLQGSISLLLPNVESSSPVSEYEPIQFGPHGDILNPFMGGSFQPQFRQSVFCAGCHMSFQPGGDPERWKWGIPIQTTWQEWQLGPLAGGGPTCQGCHMPTLDEESGAGDISDDGWLGDISVGFVRPSGEVRRHDWPSVAQLGPDAVRVEIDLSHDEAQGEIVARVTVHNDNPGHALPTGEPMRQVAVLIESDGDSLGGRALPLSAGALAVSELGAGATLEGRRLTLAGAPADTQHVRFVRDGGAWDDYDGPGAGWFSGGDATAEDKGLRVRIARGSVAVESVDADGLTLVADPPETAAGDRVVMITDDQWAGGLGWMYWKELVGADGQSPVHHGKATDIVSDNRLAPSASSETLYRFAVPAAGQTLTVRARVVYRRYPDSLARTFGWAQDDLELAAAEESFTTL